MDALLFDELLDLLEEEHFKISVTHRLRMYEFALSLSEPVDLPSLRTSLRPLLATSPQEQKRFDEIFKRYLGSAAGQSTHAKPDAEEVGIPGRIRIESETKKRRISRALTAGLVTFAVIGALLATVVLRTKHRNADVAKSSTTTTTISTDTVSDTVSTNPPSAIDTNPPATTDKTPAAAPTIEQSKPKPKEPPLRAAVKEKQTLLKFLGAVVGAILLLDLTRVIRRWKKRRKTRGQKLPYRWPLQTATIAEVFESPTVDDAVRLLRRRAAGGRTQLDLKATIRATAAAGRLATFVYSSARQSPRYIVLVERRSPDDQLAAYFRALTSILSEEREVGLNVYEFQSDPRICTDATGAPIPIGDIHERHPASRLLIMGSGESLTHPFSGELRDWVDTDLTWRARGFLLPEWTGLGVERALAQVMAVSRGDAEGLERLAGMLDRGDHGLQRAPSTPSDTLDTPIGPNPSVHELRDALDPEVFRWLTACALHPVLHWDVTIRLGRLLLDRLDGRRLLQLVRLRWFRDGSIPDGRREELAEAFRFDPRAAQAHLAIAEVLSKQKPPEDSYAAELHAMQAATHRILATPPDSPNLRPQLRDLRDFSTALVRGNDDLSTILAPSHLVPQISAIVFRGGSPVLGVRSFIRTAVFASLALVLAGFMVAATAWSYAEPPEVKKRKPWPPKTPAPELALPVPGPATTPTFPSPSLPSIPVSGRRAVSVTPGGTPAQCEARIANNGSEWTAEFVGCRVSVVPPALWHLRVNDFNLGLRPNASSRATNRFALVVITSAEAGQLSVGEYRGTLEIDDSVRYAATVIVQAPVVPVCNGVLVHDSGNLWNALVDATCAGTVESGANSQLIDEKGGIPVQVIVPTVRVDRAENTIALEVDGEIGNTMRTFRMQLGGKSYLLNYDPPPIPAPQGTTADPSPASEPLTFEPVIPPDGAQLPVEAKQFVTFRWKGLDTRTTSYRLAIECTGQRPYSTTTSGLSDRWAPPIGGPTQRLQCQWTVSALPDSIGSVVRSFTVIAGELLEVDWATKGTDVIVDGKIDGTVRRVTVNDEEVSVENGRFRIVFNDSNFVRDVGTAFPREFPITTIATLPDGSEIVDIQTAVSNR